MPLFARNAGPRIASVDRITCDRLGLYQTKSCLSGWFGRTEPSLRSTIEHWDDPTTTNARASCPGADVRRSADRRDSTRTVDGANAVFRLEQTYQGPLGSATGTERLQIRIYDLLAHGWDLAQATGQRAEPPEDLAEQPLTFVQTQLSGQPRTGRFDPAQPVSDDAPAIDRLAAFLGRRVEGGPQ